MAALTLRVWRGLPTSPSGSYIQHHPLCARASMGGACRAHNLIWGQYNPGWLTSGNYTPNEVRRQDKLWLATLALIPAHG